MGASWRRLKLQAERLLALGNTQKYTNTLGKRYTVCGWEYTPAAAF